MECKERNAERSKIPIANRKVDLEGKGRNLNEPLRELGGGLGTHYLGRAGRNRFRTRLISGRKD